MNVDEKTQLLAEKSTLLEMLAETPEEDVLDHMSLESRLRTVEKQLAAITEAQPPARASLTFRGKPVVGGHGIFAEFGALATKAFVDTVVMLAAGMAGPLAGVGRIPNREQNQLLITSTATGSFGFELEEYREQSSLLDDESAVARALAQTQALLAGTAGTDDELTEAVAGTDRRVINAVRSFLDIMANNEAVCAVDYSGHRFSFRDVAEVRRGMERLAQENVHEDEQQLTGEFQGVLPKRRTFEFKLAGEDRVIVGKVGPAISDPDLLNQHLHQATTISLVATRLGNGRPSYVLNNEPRWGEAAGETK